MPWLLLQWLDVQQHFMQLLMSLNLHRVDHNSTPCVCVISILFFLQSRVLDFDIVGHPQANFCFAVTFPFHPYKDGRKSGEVCRVEPLGLV